MSKSSHDIVHCKRRAKESSHHHDCTEDDQPRYKMSQYTNVTFDYKKIMLKDFSTSGKEEGQEGLEEEEFLQSLQ